MAKRVIRLCRGVLWLCIPASLFAAVLAWNDNHPEHAFILAVILPIMIATLLIALSKEQ